MLSLDCGPLTADPVVMIAGAMDYLPNVEGVQWFMGAGVATAQKIGARCPA